jgi:hypothetical protein
VGNRLQLKLKLLDRFQRKYCPSGWRATSTAVVVFPRVCTYFFAKQPLFANISAFDIKPGCLAFATPDKKQSLKNKTELERVLGIKFFHASQWSDLEQFLASSGLAQVYRYANLVY